MQRWHYLEMSMIRDEAIYGVKLLTEVFGANAPVFIPWGRTRDFSAGGFDDTPGEVAAEIGGYGPIVLSSPEEAERMSWMGTPVVGAFGFCAGSYHTYTAKGQMGQVEMADFLFPYATMVTFSRTMNMTQTKVIGNAGTVKEIYGLDDWGIQIQGICLTDRDRPAHQTAAEQMDELVRWRNVADRINVNGRLFSNKDIYALCIKSFSITPQQGRPGAIPFSIEAVSDEPIELVL